MLKTILAERRMEREALVVEIFASTYGCDWAEARRLALVELPSLIEYAAQWDGAILDFLSAGLLLMPEGDILDADGMRVS